MRVVRALLGLHSAGVAHGDIKLESILYRNCKDVVDSESCEAQVPTGGGAENRRATEQFLSQLKSKSRASLSTSDIESLYTCPDIKVADFGFAHSIPNREADLAWDALESGREQEQRWKEEAHSKRKCAESASKDWSPGLSHLGSEGHKQPVAQLSAFREPGRFAE